MRDEIGIQLGRDDVRITRACGEQETRERDRW
jgi:hypothetical protein